MNGQKLGYGLGSVKKIKPSDARYYYVLEYKGTLVRRCTGTTVLREAVMWAKSRVDEIKAKIDAQKDITRIRVDDLVDVYNKYLPNYTPKRALHSTATAERPISDKYYRHIVSDLESWITWLNKRGIKFAHQVSKNTVDEFIREQRLYYGPTNSYNKKLSNMQHIYSVITPLSGYDFFKDVKKIPKNITSELQAGYQPYSVTELDLIMTRSEDLLSDENKTHWRWIWFACRAGFYISLRLGDILTLKWDEIDIEGFVAHKDRKTGKADLQYIPEVVPVVDRWRELSGESGDFILQYSAETYLGLRSGCAKNSKGKVPRKIKSNTTQATKQFMSFLRSYCGIDTKNKLGKTVKGFHSLRVSHATYAAKSGLTIEDIQATLKHSSAETTKGYIKLDIDDQKALLKAQYKMKKKRKALI